MKQRSKARTINGIVSAVILLFFLLHAILGSMAGVSSFEAGVARLLWAGMVLVGVHVVACVVTSCEQLTDTVRPPSLQKKRHLVLKWGTGLALIALACVHIARVRELGIDSAIHSPIGVGVTVALAAALAVHAWTGSKSLLKDLNIDRKYRNALRVVVCAVAVVVSGALLVGMVL